MIVPEYDNATLELREYRQWVCWRHLDGKKVPFNPATGKPANVNDPLTWASYDEAKSATSRFDGIGFVLTESDPYTVIDLDDKAGNGPTPEQCEILAACNSYTEISPSGNGAHIWIRTRLSEPIKTAKVEAYSSRRYMTVTGKVMRQAAIVECPNVLPLLAKYAKTGSTPANATIERPESESDQTIVGKAQGASNGEKFSDLLSGNWRKHNYPSQSEADQSLLNILAFYTKNRAQAYRIFLSSALGQREKAKRADYKRRLLDNAYDRDLPHIDISDLKFAPLQNSAAATFATNTLGELLEYHRTAAPMQYVWGSIAPAGDVTILSADGGKGKSTFALQLLISAVANRPFMGHPTMHGPGLFVSAEDTKRVIAQRLKYIVDAYGMGARTEFTKYVYDSFHLLEIIGLALWQDQRGNSAGVPTETMNLVEQRAIETGAKIIVIDNVSSVFFSDHMALVPVTAFITHLRNMAARTGAGILLLAHVSSETATKGSVKGFYGSVAWSNAVRSRLLLESVPATNGIAEYLQLTNAKNNYAPTAMPIRLYRDDNGVLQPLANSQIANALNEKIDELAERIITQINDLNSKGEMLIAANQGSNTTYKTLSFNFPREYDETDRDMKRNVLLAVEKLAETRRIVKRNVPTAGRKTGSFWFVSDAPGCPQ